MGRARREAHMLRKIPKHNTEVRSSRSGRQELLSILGILPEHFKTKNLEEGEHLLDGKSWDKDNDPSGPRTHCVLSAVNGKATLDVRRMRSEAHQEGRRIPLGYSACASNSFLKRRYP